MALSNLTVSQTYVGNGSNKDFAIPFAFIHWQAPYDQIKVYLIVAATGVETLLVRGSDYVIDPDDVVTPPSKVTTTLAYANTYHIRVERVTTLQQILDLLDNGASYNEIIEQQGLDRLVMICQELNKTLGRALKLSNIDDGVVSPLLPMLEPDMLLQVKADGSGFQLISIDSVTGGASQTLPLPTDGKYGVPGGGASGTAGSISGVDEGDTVPDAFDKIEVILEKLAPARPPNLSAVALQIAGSYAARESTTGTARSTVIDDTTPTIASASAFSDAQLGTLSATIDAVSVGSIALTAASDVGSNGQLEILTDADYYLGQAGKENFWFVLTARINSAALALGAHIAQLIHTVTGTSTLNFSVDDPVSPSIAAAGRTLVGSGTGRRVSGIPCLTTGDTITAGFTVDNAVKSHYNSTRIASASSSQTNTVNAALPGTPPNPNDSIAASIALTVLSNAFSANCSVTATGHNSKGTTGTASLTNNIRVDSISNETTRKKSGTGQYPTLGSGAGQFGDAYDSTELLSANKELQLENATYKYPSLTNYSSLTPTAGPDYTGITADSYASMRWVTFQLGSVSSATSFSFTINGSSGFGSSALVSGIACYLQVAGATGWLDANGAYPGVGSPSSNGDPALDVGNSTATSKRVTFGATARSGNVWVRIGIPSGSTKTFTGVS